jgi:Tat protein translocase TatB subunit
MRFATLTKARPGDILKTLTQEDMFGNIGFPELLIIMAIALLVFGPKKLPEISRSIGRAVREFRRTSDEIKGKIEQEIQASEFKEIKDDLKKDLSQDIYPEVPEEKEEKKDGEGPQVT